MTQIWKDRDVGIVIKKRTMEVFIFPVAMYGCESRTVRKGGEENLCF